MSEPIRITRATVKKQKPKDSELSFGTVFTDHMFVMDFQEEKGWYDPRIEPYGPFPMDPAAAVLHYAQAVFDGLKACRSRDGKVRLFRPQKHVERLIESSRRLCIPPLDPELALKSLVTLVGMEKDWVPSTVGTSLYVRPTIIANEAFLGVRPAKSYIYYVILSPVGAYYPEGMNPVKILVVDKYERAVSIDEVAAAARNGTLQEVWGTGTAAVISPVGELSYKGERIVINGGRIGPLTQKLYDSIVGIQYGTVPDTRGWTVAV